MRDHDEREGSAGSATFFTLFLNMRLLVVCLSVMRWTWAQRTDLKDLKRLLVSCRIPSSNEDNSLQPLHASAVGLCLSPLCRVDMLGCMARSINLCIVFLESVSATGDFELDFDWIPCRINVSEIWEEMGRMEIPLLFLNVKWDVAFPRTSRACMAYYWSMIRYDVQSSTNKKLNHEKGASVLCGVGRARPAWGSRSPPYTCRASIHFMFRST